MRQHPVKPSGGFTLMVAIFLIVVLAALAVTIATLSSTQRQTASLSILGARTYAAAASGMEWAVHQALTAPVSLNCGTPAGASFNLAGGVLDGFTITVTCAETAGIVEGATGPYSVYALIVNASRGTLGSPDYLNRTLQATVSNAP